MRNPRVLIVALALLGAGALVGAVAVRAASKPKVTASFVVEPAHPLVGQLVRFGSTSAVTSGGGVIVRNEWDLDGDGTFETDTGAVPAATRRYSSAGSVEVSLRVTDSRGKQDLASRGVDVRNPPRSQPPNNPPSASFIFSPSSPVIGQTITFASISTDPEDAIDESSWDLNSDGRFGDAIGPVAQTAFPSAGSRTVSLRVTDSGGLESFDTQTVTVYPSAAVGLRKARGKISMMNPFPVIRIAGRFNDGGVRIRLFTVVAPGSAKVVVRCKGRGCPFHRKRLAPRRRSKARAARLIRARSLERSLPAGVRLVVTVTKPNQIGKYTLFKVRSGQPPARIDRCLMPGSAKPRRCTEL